MYTDAPVHQCTCSVYFFIFSITGTVTFPPIWWGMYTQILMLLLCLRTKTYLSSQLLVYLPLNVPNHDPACSFSYFKYSVWLTAKIYPSTFLLRYLSTGISVHEYTCSVFLPFRHNIHNYISAHLLGYIHTDPTGINLPVNIHTSPLSNNKDVPVITNTYVPAHRCTLSWSYLFIFILYFKLNTKIYSSTFLLRCMTVYLFIFIFLFRLTTDIYPFMSYLFIFILQINC